MWNVLLDPLPEDWKGYPIDPDFQTGIQISLCFEDESLNKREKLLTALSLLFPDEHNRPPFDEAQEALEWYMTDFNHDHHTGKKSEKKVMDFDVDQWRIYAAFLNQYNIDLNSAKLHWFVFMGLLSNLEESSFGRVIDIRQKKPTSKMKPEEKKALIAAKEIFSLGNVQERMTVEEKAAENEALELFNRMRSRS